MTRTFVRSSFALCIVLAIPTTAAPAPAAAAVDDPQTRCEALPANIQVDRFLRDVVIAMLRRSPTFQRQCRDIAARRGVRVVVQAVWAARLSSEPRARATIGRYQHGFMRATIEVPMFGDHAELIPHEFEHVIEQMEGVDLAALAKSGRANLTPGGYYETARARAAGIAAAHEYHDHHVEPAVEAARFVRNGVWRALQRPVRRSTPLSPALRR